MDQLVVLQEIYASFLKGGDGLQKIDNKAIEGSCHELISQLLESSRKGRIDEDICHELSLKLQDVYEIKRLGDICRRAGLHNLSINTYNRALSLCRDPILRPVLQNNLGQANACKGDLAKAAFYYQKAADCFAREGDHIGLAHVLGNLGSAYRRSRNWDKAIEYYYRSLKTFEEGSDDLGIAQMTGSLGRTYADMGEMELAARYLERSLTDFQRLGDKRSAAWVLDRLGKIAGQRKDWDKALGYLHSSLSLFEEQGESSSQGIVLSNLGCTFLQMGQATAAREPLERAVLLISCQLKPNYQNALYCLAKTYNCLAKSCLQEAESSEEAENNAEVGEKEKTGRVSNQQQRQEASQLFAQAADRYLELASTHPNDLAEIKVAAAIAKSRSYLARLCGQVPDEEALALAEKAQASLDNAAANADDDKKAGILGLQRIIASMKEAYSIELLANEPLKQTRALTNATEYLMGGGQGWTQEEDGFLCQALKNINASIEMQKSRRDPTEKLRTAAAALRHAKKHFDSAEEDPIKIAEIMIAKAAEVLEVTSANVSRQCQEEQTTTGSGYQIAFAEQRAALLLIARALASDSLSKIDDNNNILTWDEALDLLPTTEKGKSSVQIKINDVQVEPNPEPPGPITKTDLPVREISKEKGLARDMILADGSREASEIFVLETANHDDGWLVPIKADVACKSSGQLFLHTNAKKEMPLKQETKRQESHERAFPGANVEGNGERNEEPIDVLGDQGYDKGYDKGYDPDHEEQLQKAGTEYAGPESSEAPQYPEIEKRAQESAFNHSKAIFLLKGLTALLVMLLAIEAILYLI
ncbi:MAG: tetratricopeptide repeat protein [Methanotrichaceae archaeon]|nr:tetratricopeptide repeat protein [Methanotrichaceae archaeon]